jgi:hypothetical protein
MSACNALYYRIPPGLGADRAMGILTVGQPLGSWVTSNIRENKFYRCREHFFDNPGKILLWTVFEHVSRDHSIEFFIR